MITVSSLCPPRTLPYHPVPVPSQVISSGKPPAGTTRKEMHTLLALVVGDLGWTHWQRHEETWNIVRFPEQVARF